MVSIIEEARKHIKQQTTWMSVNDVVKWDINPRVITREGLDRLKNKIMKYPSFFLARPILVNCGKDGRKVVFCGNQRLEASRELGLQEVPVIIFDNLPLKTQKELAIIDNHNDGADDVQSLVLNFSDIDFKGLTGLDLKIDVPTVDTEELTPRFDTFGPSQEHNPSNTFENNNSQLTQNQEQGKYGGWDKNEKYLHYENPVPLRDVYSQPPFSVLDGKQAPWLERKRFWRELYEDGANRQLLAKGPLAANLNTSSKYGNSIIDPVLCEVVCKWFTPHEKANIFDCFAGDTGFGFVSSYLGHNFSGVELRKEQCEENTKQCANNQGSATYFCDDGRNLDKYIAPESQDLFFSCPPYFNLEKYSDNANDLSNMSYDNFIKAFEVSFSKAVKALKNNRFAIVVMSDVRNRDTGAYYTICDEIRRIFKDNGCAVYNEIILLTPFASAPLRCSGAMKSRKTVRVHQEVLCFYKGDPTKIKEHFKALVVNENTGANEEVGTQEDECEFCE